ncbi:MAG: hypothetical protein JWO32_2657 [Bacteroidetes bacterium]|nr:hypothetical protein [Bacteroidota bacterium]
MKKVAFIFLFFLTFLRQPLFAQKNSVQYKIKQADSLFAFNKDSAIKLLLHLTKAIDSRKAPYELAMAYKSLGMSYYFKANYPEALINYQKSEKLIEANKFTDLEISLRNLLGTFYKKQKLYKKASDEFEKGYQQATAINDSSNIAGLLGDMGLVFAEQNKYKEARPFFERSLSIYLLKNNLRGASYAYDYLAEAYAAEGKYDEAIKLMKKALQIREHLNDESLVAVNLNNIGEVYIQQGEHGKALPYLNKSIILSVKLKYADLLQHSLGLLAECYMKEGNFKLAYEYNLKKNNLKDSIFNERNSQIIQEAEGKYQSVKKQNEIDKLSAANLINEVKVSKQQNVILFFVSVLLLAAAAFAIIAKYYRKVKKSNRIITLQHIQTEHQKKIIEEKQSEILDSINYAKRIQNTVFAQTSFLQEHLKTDFFVMFKPKDIVSGDFYWAASNHDSFYLAVCDSTGHGVPGAFMSLLNVGYLSEAINEKNIQDCGQVLNYVRQRLIHSVNKDGQQDGFDGILLRIEKSGSDKKISYASAYNSPLLISNNNVKHLPADKMPVGIGEKTASFTTGYINAASGDIVYLFTDGYPDQFGGAKGKKFKYKQLEELLLSNHHLPLTQQKEILETTFEEWRGPLEQVDDVLIIGIKI